MRISVSCLKRICYTYLQVLDAVGIWAGSRGRIRGGGASGPGGSWTVRVAEIGLAGTAGMAEAVDSTAASGPQAESSGGIMLPCADWPHRRRTGGRLDDAANHRSDCFSAIESREKPLYTGHDPFHKDLKHVHSPKRLARFSSCSARDRSSLFEDASESMR